MFAYVHVCAREPLQVLERARVKLPEDWLYVDNVAGQWSAFNEVFHRRMSALESKREDLVALVLGEEQTLEKRCGFPTPGGHATHTDVCPQSLGLCSSSKKAIISQMMEFRLFVRPCLSVTQKLCALLAISKSSVASYFSLPPPQTEGESHFPSYTIEIPPKLSSQLWRPKFLCGFRC